MGKNKIPSARLCSIIMMLLGCLIFGGSASAPRFEIGLSVLALLCFVMTVYADAHLRVSKSTVWIAGLALGVVVAQIVPLPAIVWRQLPQGEFADTLSPSIQPDRIWRSISIAPDTTLYSLIAMGPFFLAFFISSSLKYKERCVVIIALVLETLVQAVIGIAQTIGILVFSMYDIHHPRVAIGLFASRNHFADQILIGTMFLFYIRKSSYNKLGILNTEIYFYSILVVFATAMLCSASRAGIILLGVAIILGYSFGVKKNQQVRFALVVVLISILTFLVLFFFPKTGVLKTTVARFANADENRWEIWSNCLAVSAKYFPWGSGLGTFRQAYEMSEPLSSVGQFYVNAAHNEYLQLLVEMGAAGVVGMFALIMFMIVTGWRKRHDPMVVFSLGGLGLIALHSFVDYPFRVIGINTVCACAFGFVISKCRVKNNDRFDSAKRSYLSGNVLS